MAAVAPFVVLLLGLASAQTPSNVTEVHPKLQTWKCTKAGGCVKQTNALVIDSLSHNVHQRDNPSLSCGNWGNAPNETVCPDKESCARNCILEGVTDYSKYGVTTNGGSLHLKHLGEDGSVLSPRVYLLSPNASTYEMLQLTGNEFSFDVDVSKLPCGMNGALYLSEMDASGGRGLLNPGGATYGTGYCDAQCFTTPFINGVGNIEGKGSCCSEMDIWEANRVATQMAPHTCNQTGLYQCTGAECAFDGVCDKNGCGHNVYGLGDKSYYGPNLHVDTSRPFTVVTQFPDEDGVLKEIRRLYVQDGRVYENGPRNVSSLSFIDDAYCQATNAERYMDLGANAGMGEALSRGMVLIFSIWWDAGGFMNWLDSGNAGPCNATEGDPAIIRQIQPDTDTTFSNIKWGEIGSTFTSSNTTLQHR